MRTGKHFNQNFSNYNTLSHWSEFNNEWNYNKIESIYNGRPVDIHDIFSIDRMTYLTSSYGLVIIDRSENEWNILKLHWSVHPDRNQEWRDHQDKLLGPSMAAQECDTDFITSGNTVVDPVTLQFYEQTHVKDPVEKKGFDGNLWVWDYPNYTKDYIVSADVARGDASDWSAFHVLDVETLEQVAEYRGKIGTKDFGNMCAYLISDEANKVSGQVIAVDGNAERMD